MANNNGVRLIGRLLIGLTIVFMLRALNPTLLAQGIIVKTEQITLDGPYADFGTGSHGFGKPSGSGSVAWEYSTSGDSLVAKVTIKGTLYVDTSNFLGRGPTSPDELHGARLYIRFYNGADLIDLKGEDLCCFKPFSNENDVHSRLGINESFASSSLSSVKLTVVGLIQTGGIRELGNSTDASSSPADTKKYDVTINNGNSDFGGEPHALGSPVTSGSVQLTRDTNGVVPNGKVVGRVKGTLYWDALFDKGCTRLIIDFQDLNGANLKEKTTDKCGSGGNANDSPNKLSVNESFTSGSLMRIHLRLGTLQPNGSFTNIETKTYGWN